MKKKILSALCLIAVLTACACSGGNAQQTSAAETSLSADTSAAPADTSLSADTQAAPADTSLSADTQAAPAETSAQTQAAAPAERLTAWNDVDRNTVIASLAEGSDTADKDYFDITFGEFFAEYYCSMLSAGIADDTAADSADRTENIRGNIINYLSFERIFQYIAKNEYGITEDTIPDDAKKKLRDSADESIAEWSAAYSAQAKTELGADASSDDISKRARELLTEDFARHGVPADIFYKWNVSDYIRQSLLNEIIGDVTPTDADVDNMFAEYAAEAKEAYEKDVSVYESTQQYNAVYIPDGSRTIQQILLFYSDDAAKAISEAKDSDAKKAAVQDAYTDELKAKVSEIQQKIAEGKDFSELQTEYDENGQNMFFVVPNSVTYPAEARDALFALTQTGTVTEPVITESGVFLIKYVDDTVMTDDMISVVKDSMREYLSQQNDQEKQQELFAQWAEQFPYDTDFETLKITKPSEQAE